MPAPIDRQEVQRLLAAEQAQLVEVLPAPEYQDEHLPVVRVYAQHYNGHRPHRSLAQRPPLAKPPPIDEPAPRNELLQLDHLRRRERLGGLLHEYELAA